MIKQLLISGILILLAVTANIEVRAQEAPNKRVDVSIMPFTMSDIGFMFSANVGYNFNRKIQAYAGLRYQYGVAGRDMPDSKQHLLRHRFNGTGLGQNLGYGFGIQYNLPSIFKYVDIFAFYDATFFRSDTRAYRYEFVENYINEPTAEISLTLKKDYNLKQVNSLESNIGIGFRSMIRGMFFFTAKGGVGINNMNNLPTAYFSNGHKSEMSTHLSIGFGVSF